MPASDRRYVVCAVHWPDEPNKPEFLAIEGQMVVFDTLQVAQDFLPRLFAGRIHFWDAKKETLSGLEIDRCVFNRLAIYTGYDPYDVPNGFRAKGIYSEAEGRDWKHHTHYVHNVPALLAWADQMEAARNNTGELSEV